MLLEVHTFLITAAVAIGAAVQISKFVMTELTGLWIYLRVLRAKAR